MSVPKSWSICEIFRRNSGYSHVLARGRTLLKMVRTTAPLHIKPYFINGYVNNCVKQRGVAAEGVTLLCFSLFFVLFVNYKTVRTSYMQRCLLFEFFIGGKDDFIL